MIGRLLCRWGLHVGDFNAALGTWPYPVAVECPRCHQEWIDHGPGSMGY